MTIAPQQAGTHGPKKNPKTDSTQRPELITYLIGIWTFMVGAELLHQILSVIMSLVDPSALKAAARETAEQSPEVPEAAFTLSVYFSIGIMALITLAIVGLLVWMLVLFAKQHKWAGYARRLLSIFSLFFALRMLLVFLSTPAASGVPVWVFAVDGMVQIALGVAGILGLIFANKEEALAWTGEDKRPPFADSGNNQNTTHNNPENKN